MKSLRLKNKTIMPVIDHHSFQSRIELFSILKSILNTGYWEIYNAYEAALSFYNEGRGNLLNVYQREKPVKDEISVALLGRPYAIMQNSMNKGIPDIFSALNIKTFYQDMLPVDAGRFDRNRTPAQENALELCRTDFKGRALYRPHTRSLSGVCHFLQMQSRFLHSGIF